MGQKYAAYTTSGTISGFYDAVDSPPPKTAQLLKITDAQWLACLATPGFSVANGALSPPPAGSALAQAQAQLGASLSLVCQAQITAGFTSQALGASYSYPSQLTDQHNLTFAALAALGPGLAASWSAPLMCADPSGNWASRPHNAAQVQQVASDCRAMISANLSHLAALRAKIAISTTAAALSAISW